VTIPNDVWEGLEEIGERIDGSIGPDGKATPKSWEVTRAALQVTRNRINELISLRVNNAN